MQRLSIHGVMCMDNNNKKNKTLSVPQINEVILGTPAFFFFFFRETNVFVAIAKFPGKPIGPVKTKRWKRERRWMKPHRCTSPLCAQHAPRLSAAGKVKWHTRDDDRQQRKSLFRRWEKHSWSCLGYGNTEDCGLILRSCANCLRYNCEPPPPPPPTCWLPSLCPLFKTRVLRRAPAERQWVWCHWSASAARRL